MTLHARHHSGAYVSSALRLKEIMAHSSNSPTILDDLQAYLGKCRVAPWALKHLMLRDHPAIRGVAAEDIVESISDKVVYRLDEEIQFSDFSGARVRDSAAVARTAEQPTPPNLGEADHVMQWATLDHFRETADQEDWFAVAMPRGAGSVADTSPFVSFADALSETRAQDQRPSDISAIEFEEEGTSSHARLTPSTRNSVAFPPFAPIACFTLFKVQHFHPARLRRARGDASTLLLRDDVVITLFEMESVDLGRKVVVTRGQPITDGSDLCSPSCDQ